MSALNHMANNVKTKDPAIREQARSELAAAVAGFEVQVIEPKHKTVPLRPVPKRRIAPAPVRTPRNPNTLLMSSVLEVVRSRENLSIALKMAIDWKTAVPQKHASLVRDLMKFWPLLQKIKASIAHGRTIKHFAEKYGYSPAYIQELADRFNVQNDAEVAHVL